MIQIIFALLAGIVTVASPCILPILPVILGVSIGHTSKTRPLYIVSGFVITFSVIALGISYAARHLGLSPGLVRTIGIVILGIFGLLLLWPSLFEKMTSFANPLLLRIGSLGNPANRGNLSGFILGMTLGIVWAPCSGPVLASILTLIALQKETAVAGILVVAYSIGAGIPMLLIAYGGQYLSNTVRSVARYSQTLQRIFGVVIVLLAIALYFNYDTLIYSAILSHFPSVNPIL